jgi:hypothetical protein
MAPEAAGRAAYQDARQAMNEYPYRFHVALDGSGMNGLEGMAGVCQFLFDPRDNAYAHKIVYYGGVAGGHAVLPPARAAARNATGSPWREAAACD